MTTRARKLNDTPGLADLEGAANPVDAPGIMPPPGVIADVDTRVRYQRTITPNENGNYSDELRNLAAEEIEDDVMPIPDITADPLTEFCSTWRNYIGYSLRVVRLPDPANKRIPGQAYNNTCFEITALGAVPFEPNNIVPTLQLINGNSGGAFRLFLADENGQPIPGARLDRILVPDPPKQYSTPRQYINGTRYEDSDYFYQTRVQQQPPTPAPPPQKSETEVYIEQMQRELFQKVMMRALDPPALPAVDPLSTIPEGDRLALSLLRQGDLLPTLVERISSLAQAPDRIESATWKDKLADAGIQLVTHNPQIITTATDIISRATVAITQALANAFAPRNQQIINEPIPIQHTPAQRTPMPQLPYSGGRVESMAQVTPPPQQVYGLPETPQPEDEDLDDTEELTEAQQIEMEMLDETLKLLLSEKPLRLDDPIILDLQEAYPKQFATVMAGIAGMPSQTLIQYVCSISEFCAEQFNSQRNGPYLRQRLEEFKGLLTAQIQANAQTNQPQTEVNAPGEAS